MALQTFGRSDEIVETLHLLRFSSIHLHYLQTDLCYRVHDDCEIAASGQQRLGTPYCQCSDRVLVYEQRHHMHAYYSYLTYSLLRLLMAFFAPFTLYSPISRLHSQTSQG